MIRTRIIVFLVITLGLLFAFTTHYGITLSYQDIYNNLRPTSSSTSQSGNAPHCRWNFEHYESSQYEESWFSNIKTAQESICAAVAKPEHRIASDTIIRGVQDLKKIPEGITWNTIDTAPLTDAEPDYEFMSQMHYSRSCWSDSSQSFERTSGYGIQLIEPLWGYLRDPFDPYCDKIRLTSPTWKAEEVGEWQSKEHIMPQGFAPYAYDEQATGSESLHKWRRYGTPPWTRNIKVEKSNTGFQFFSAQNIHLDLGSAYFTKWYAPQAKDSKEPPRQLAGGSGEWFYNHYHKRGIEFSRFIAVEVDELDDKEVWNDVPADLIGKYTLINAPLTMTEGDRLNTIDMIKRIVDPEDFFVFKLDIDSAPIEEPIVQMLLRSDDASSRVDELMFEHHVKYFPLAVQWDLVGPKGDNAGTLEDSYHLFRNLRRKGIRAHSWP